MIWYVLLILVFYWESATSQVTKRENILLSRKKRYLFFPKGANFVYQFVNVKALMKRVPKGVQWLNEWDVPFPLPSDPGEFREYRQSHREERGVFNDFAEAFDSGLRVYYMFNLQAPNYTTGAIMIVYRQDYRKDLFAPKYIIWFNEWTVVFPLPYDPAELRDLRRKHRIHRRHLHENFAITLTRYGLNGTACVNRMICEAREFIPLKGKSLIKDMLYAVFSRPEDELSDGDREASEDACHVSNFEECTAPLLHIMLGSLTNY